MFAIHKPTSAEASLLGSFPEVRTSLVSIVAMISCGFDFILCPESFRLTFN